MISQFVTKIGFFDFNLVNFKLPAVPKGFSSLWKVILYFFLNLKNMI